MPDARPRRALSLLAAALVLLLLGAAVAAGVSGTLGIRFTPAAVPTESPTAAPARAAVAAPAVRTLVIPDDQRVALAALLGTVILLLALVNRGPGHYWMNFWIHPLLRSAYVTVAFAAFGWVFLAAWFVLRDRYRLAVRGALGRLLPAIGAPLAVLGTLIAVIGLERALTWWDDQMNLLPWGLHRILGITVYLGIPTILPTVAAVLGLVLMAAGGLLAAPWRRRPASA